jgi:hypothetical protein
MLGGIAVAGVVGGAVPLWREVARRSQGDRKKQPWEEG